MKTNVKQALLLYSTIWFAVGFMLLYKGISYLILGTHFILIPTMSNIFSSSQDAALLCIVLGLAIGVMKAKKVLKKVAAKLKTQATLSQNPYKAIFSIKTCIMVAIMMSFGAILRWINLPQDLFGIIDVAVGAALIQGGYDIASDCFFSKSQEISEDLAVDHSEK